MKDKSLQNLRVKIFADGADKAGMLSLNADPLIKGMTTNPSLMRKAGIQNYETFAKEILQTAPAKPISFEVFSDEFPEMRRQALKIASWQKNVYVKIPAQTARSTFDGYPPIGPTMGILTTAKCSDTVLYALRV